MRPEAEGFELAVKGKNEDWQIISVRPRSFFKASQERSLGWSGFVTRRISSTWLWKSSLGFSDPGCHTGISYIRPKVR